MHMPAQYGMMPAHHMSETCVETIEVPDSAVGLIIGRGGEQISSLQTSTGSRIQMSPDSVAGQRHCTIQGPRISVERAKQLIYEIVQRAGNRPPPGQRNGDPPSGPGFVTVEVLIPPNKCGLVIGKQGDTIRQLQDQSGVRMQIVQDNHEVTGDPKPLRITGDPHKVDMAKRLVENIIAGGPEGMAQSRVYGGEATARGEIVVPRSSVGMIIGKNGETVRRLGLETNTKIQFKADDDPSSTERVAVVTGPKDQIVKVTAMITDLADAASGRGGPQSAAPVSNNMSVGSDVFYMHVPANKTGAIIGKGGEIIKQINIETGAFCELSRDPPPNSHEKIFVIKGTPYQIHQAQHCIRVRVGEIPPDAPMPPYSGPGGPVAPSFPVQQVQAMGYQFSGMQQSGYPRQFGADSSVGNMYLQHHPLTLQQQQFGVPTAVVQPTVAVQQGGDSSQPGINPANGQPDYSRQWIDYYRSLGMHDHAASIEQQVAAKSMGAAQQYGYQPTN